MDDHVAAVDTTEWVAGALDEYQAHLINYAVQLLGDVDVAAMSCRRRSSSSAEWTGRP